jgi:hypothetical protein
MAPVLLLERPDDPAATAAALAAALGRRWRVIADAVLRVAEEEGRVDLVALHPRRGIALVGFLAGGEEANPEEAVAAMRAMLAKLAIARHFPGQVTVVALLAPLGVMASADGAKRLATTVRAAFVGTSPTTAAAGWVDWLAERLAPADETERGGPYGESARGAGLPRLIAPRRDEEPPSAGEGGRLGPPAETPLRAAVAADGWGRWILRAALAVGLTLLLLTLLALFSRGGLDF